MDLTNKVVIISGGAASIGADITKEMHAQGAQVVIADINKEAGEALAKSLGENALFVPTDITLNEQLENLVVATIDKFGKIDALVNNAASYGDEGATTDRNTWLKTLDVNVVSAAMLGELCRPQLKKNKGCIINTGSVSGNFPHIARWAYPVSKAALAHLTKTQAVEYAEDGIRVNLLRLGHIWSDPFNGLTKGDRQHADQATAAFNLKGRVANGKEVGQVAAFVASDKASYMTGGEIPVDGGYSAMGPEGHMPLFPILAK
ncbi:SDR family oxidoreductase [Sediminicola luteus]|uniref:Short-chain dehydrogenase n=1 Tax=Sediminicola luteus TaxID=319238 RepID=A0A2A4GD37_9FLAO|nr:SDR family oxidoreductase [Sediminicola luteus]PCE65898.1 short-chain dehydrogenase [Sediminicola luteus]